MKTRFLTRATELAGAMLLAGGLTAAHLAAADPAPPAAAATTTGVPFISGGVGETERTEMNEHSSNFNLRVITAKANGDYLAGVNLTIRNEKGSALLTTVTPGPLLMAQLPPGKYTVTASNGSDVRKETVTVDRGRQAVVLIHLGDA